MKLIRIIDVNGKPKLAKYVRVINHPIRDAVTNTYFTERWVEALIVGRNRNMEWKEYYPLDKFKELNPHIKLEE